MSTPTRYLRYQYLHRMLAAEEAFEQLTPERYAQFQSRHKHLPCLNDSVFVMCFSGEDWNGAFSRETYLCLSEAEAKSVGNLVKRPKRKVSRLTIEGYLSASYRPVTLEAVLANEGLREKLIQRLKKMLPYTEADYLQADSVYYWMDEAKSHHLLANSDGILWPKSEQGKPLLPFRLRVGGSEAYIVVRNENGLAGVVNKQSKFVLDCIYEYISEPKSGLIEVREAQPEFDLPLKRDAFWQFTCDVINLQSRQDVSPPNGRPLQASLDLSGIFVAIHDVSNFVSGCRLGFANYRGHWLGEPVWQDLFLFNDGMAAIQSPDTHLWGFVDGNGSVEIAPSFLQPSFFNHDRAIVFMSSDEISEGVPALIDKTGAVLTSDIWRRIEYARGNTYLAQDRNGYWGLLDKQGQTVVEPFDYGSHDTVDVIEHIHQCYQKQRAEKAKLLKNLPLAQAVKQLGELASQRDFEDVGLWLAPVKISNVPEAYVGQVNLPESGIIGWAWPVTASIFDFEMEAPANLRLISGESLILGIPWEYLELEKQ